MNFLDEIKALLKDHEIGTILLFGFISGLLVHSIFGGAGVVVAVLVYLVYKYKNVLLAGLESKVQTPTNNNTAVEI